MIRVLIADDEAMMRAGVRAILESDPDIEVVFEATNGHEAISGVQRYRPDIAVLDIRMPGLDGLGAAAEIGSTAPATRVVMLTTFGEDDYVERALEDGALGFLLKAADPRELIAGVRAVAAGGAYLSPVIARHVIAPYREGDRIRSTEAREAASVLSDREREVLALIGAGASNAEIGRRLHLVEGTVKGYVSAILIKLRVRNRVEAAVLAHRAGLVEAG
ncbi:MULTISPECIES: response regulator transcription factor [unclassified Microbacterium]|uniref:response regulator n=1 Tax=unclassified Microbacterium TaxID=2609290 RepID=UPI000EAA6154|nr:MULTISPECIES: response regulator transcription factor [unclassified Microbacterium]MBT2483820.1 response regulator transcription factor [Microbacterium sp. ISL-108]RKN66803.1 DNA-binding response regulator [Microbacterium sp. CGR2]